MRNGSKLGHNNTFAMRLFALLPTKTMFPALSLPCLHVFFSSTLFYSLSPQLLQPPAFTALKPQKLSLLNHYE